MPKRLKKTPAADLSGELADFGPLPQYPTHERFEHFDRAFFRLLSKVAVVNSVGIGGRILLEEIVLVEDARWYADAPTFWIQSLADRCGFHRNTCAKYIQKCVEAGWLFWRKASDRELGVGWVTIPPKYRPMLESSKNFGVVHKNSARDCARDCAPVAARNCAPSTLEPKPSPLPEEWAAAGECVKETGLTKHAEAVRAAVKNDLRPSDVLKLVDHWRAVSAGFMRPHGALFAAISSTRPQSMANVADCFPPLSSEFLARQAATVRQVSESARRERDRAAEKARASVLESSKKLEIDFEARYGSQLDELSDAELVKLCAKLPSVVLTMTRKHGRKAPAVRLELLKAIAD